MRIQRKCLLELSYIQMLRLPSSHAFSFARLRTSIGLSLSTPHARDSHKDTTTNAFADYNQLKITVESTLQHAFQIEKWEEIQQV